MHSIMLNYSFRTFCEGLQFLVIHLYILVLQVVLLGDHKQLRPIVKNEHVRRLGMTHSLFERYMDRALLLDTQYRMVQDKHIHAPHLYLHIFNVGFFLQHEEICKFPSEAYYLGRLITKVDERTSVLQIETERTRQSKHILFGDIQGEEISLVVSTARGNENSKANFAEVKKAVSERYKYENHQKTNPIYTRKQTLHKTYRMYL